MGRGWIGSVLGAVAAAFGILPLPAMAEAEVLPRARLFEPLIADPRWAHFSAAYQYYSDDPEVTHVGAVSFGENFTLYGAPVGAGRWSAGLQAAVFSIFDLDADSKDLINADYWVGIPVAYRLGRFSALARVFHQSSHLGDEFLLRRRVDRVNLSYEAVDAKLSYDLTQTVRVYGGGGYLVSVEPADIRPWGGQAGAEYRSGTRWAGGALRPVAAVDLQASEEAGWDVGVSARAGVQLESTVERGYVMQLMLEAYRGSNPNGQFFDRDIRFIGLGLHLYL